VPVDAVAGSEERLGQQVELVLGEDPRLAMRRTSWPAPSRQRWSVSSSVAVATEVAGSVLRCLDSRANGSNVSALRRAGG
jgi:hypothetical protein